MASPQKLGAGDSGLKSLSPFAMDRVVINSSGMEVPMLTKANYHEWALVMQVNLEGMELWDAMESEKVDRGKDRRALAAILRGVPPEMKSGLASKKSAKEAWAAVKSLRMGDARVQEAKAQHLLKQFELAAFKDGEAINDFALRLGSLATELRELGEKMEEERVVKKMLRVVPARYNQIACSIEMFADLKTMSMEELVGRLHVVEERCGGVEAAADGVGRLLLTKEQWEERRRQRGSKQRTRGGDEAHRGGGERRGGRNDGHNDDDDGSSTSSGFSRRNGSRYRGRCFDCGERGHMARDCRGKKKERALLADIDDEPTLM